MELERTNTSKKPLISISIPVLNEVENIPVLYDRLCDLAHKMATKCDLEFVFSDNYSNDETWEILKELSQKDQRVKAIKFSKNVGFQRSILANYIHTQGDAVMQLDADLQDPPELLEDFFNLWQQGYQVVYGIRNKRKEGRLINGFRRFGYWVIDKLSDHPIPRDVGDFRLIDKKVVNSLSKIQMAKPYIRGMIAELGFNQTGVSYNREARNAGKSKFDFTGLIRLGLTGVFNHSTVPLRAASYLGLMILVLSFLGTLYYLALRIFFLPDLPQGLASIHILVLFGIGLNAFLLGVIGEYLLRIYLIIRAEPVAIVIESLNFSPSEIKF